MGIIEQAQPRPGRVRSLAANAALTIHRDDAVISAESTNATVKAATLTVTQPGHVVHIVVRERSSTGSYQVVTSDGTVLLNSSGEGCVIICDGTEWHLAGLTGGSTWTPS